LKAELPRMNAGAPTTQFGQVWLRVAQDVQSWVSYEAGEHIYKVGSYSCLRSRMRLRVNVIRQRVLALGSVDPGCLIVPMS
jgi:hypothetical protein